MQKWLKIKIILVILALALISEKALVLSGCTYVFLGNYLLGCSGFPEKEGLTLVDFSLDEAAAAGVGWLEFGQWTVTDCSTQEWKEWLSPLIKRRQY